MLIIRIVLWYELSVLCSLIRVSWVIAYNRIVITMELFVNKLNIVLLFPWPQDARWRGTGKVLGHLLGVPFTF